MARRRRKSAILETWNKFPTPLKYVTAGIAIYGTYKGVKYLRNRIPAAQLPAGGAGIPTVGYTQTGQAIAWDPKPMSDQLYNAMSGLFTTSGTKDEAWTALIQLPTNDMLTAVYNQFNKDHGNGTTLTAWIDDEYYYDYFTGVKVQALNKLRGAGLAEFHRETSDEYLLRSALHRLQMAGLAA